MPAGLTPQHFRELRSAKQLTQKAAAEKLGVTPNTVARWERGEVRIPHWVSLLFRTQAKLTTTNEQLAQLQEQNKDLKSKLREVRRELKWEQEIGSLFGTSPACSPAAEQIYKRIASKYHPDRNEAHAETMKDINELYQALRQKPANAK